MGADRPGGRAAVGRPRLSRIARVCVAVEPIHLDRPFDYLVPDGTEVVAGQRVLVDFAGRRVGGVVLEVTDHSDVAPDRLRPLVRVVGDHVWLRDDDLSAARWLADRTGAPLADVLRHALPKRVVAVERRATEAGWYPRAPRPADPPPLDPDALATAWAPYADTGVALLDAVRAGRGSFLWRPLPGEDVAARIGELVRTCLAHGRDALVVVPDPASPAADQVAAACGDLAVDLRERTGDQAVYRRWLEARTGRARVVVGLRGVALWPLERLGLAVVLDEANPALKDRRSPRHHAREVVLERARRAAGVGLLVGTVPSAPAWRLLRTRRVRAVVPTREAERDARPQVVAVPDDGRVRTRIAREAVRALRHAVAHDTYGVVLASRRGEGRALVCGRCGQRETCPTCASSLRLDVRGGVACEGCGWRVSRPAACTGCGERRPVPLAAGAQWLGRELTRAVSAPVVVLEGYGRVPPPPPAVLVTTRGSVLDTPPGPVGAVVLADLDGSLRRPTLDAAEDTLRLAFQVATWAAHPTTRAALPDGGQVVVQSREPDHHAIRALVRWDPGSFWRAEEPLRAPLRFPPAAVAIRLAIALPAAAAGAGTGAGAGGDVDGEAVDAALREALPPGDALLGPVPDGDDATYLVKTDDRAATLAALRPLRERLSRAGTPLRVDVDPVDAL